MAQPPPYGAPPGAPPAYASGYPTDKAAYNPYASAPPCPPYQPAVPYNYRMVSPTPQPAPVNVVVVQQAPPPRPARRGFISGIVGDLSKGVHGAARDVTGVASKLYHGDVMKHLSTGSVIQLYFKNTGKTVQIVQSPNGTLIPDILGFLSPQAYNAHWIVYQELGNVIKLYNQDNYIGIHNNQVILIKAANPVVAPPETRWKVCQSSSSSEISLQSMYNPNFYLSATENFNALTLSGSSVLSQRTYFTIQHVSHIGGKN